MSNRKAISIVQVMVVDIRPIALFFPITSELPPLYFGQKMFKLREKRKKEREGPQYAREQSDKRDL